MRINFEKVRRAFGDFGLFSTQDLKNQFSNFDSRRLIEWQAKAYILRIANRWYLFSDAVIDEPYLRWTASRLYSPSYLSLETALSFYGLIPEGVYMMTSVSSRKTRTIDSPIGYYTYHHLQPSQFFGYRVLRNQFNGRLDRPVLMAYMEKALIDFCYFNSNLKSIADFEGMRLNASSLKANLDEERLQNYLDLFSVSELNKQMRTLRKYIERYA